MKEDKIEEMLHREGLKTASFAKRAGAYAIDEAIITIIVLMLFWNNLVTLSEDMSALSALLQKVTIFTVVLRVIYQSIFAALYGATLGKMALKIYIVEIATLDKPTAMNSILRSITREILGGLLYLTYLFAIGDIFCRTLHDRFSKTLVLEMN